MMSDTGLYFNCQSPRTLITDEDEEGEKFRSWTEDNDDDGTWEVYLASVRDAAEINV